MGVITNDQRTQIKPVAARAGLNWRDISALHGKSVAQVVNTQVL
jgi:hypothetical protein